MTAPDYRGERADLNDSEIRCHAIFTDQYAPGEYTTYEDLFYLQREVTHRRIWTVWKTDDEDEPEYVTTLNIGGFVSSRQFANSLVKLAEKEYGNDEE